MHPSWSRRRRWTEFVCVESGLVLRILQATLGVSTDLLSTPKNALMNILPWQGGVRGKETVSCGGGSFQLRPDLTVLVAMVFGILH